MSDTFTEFTNSDLGMKAKQVLEKAGYSVIVPPWICCGRTLISKGLLPQAKKQAEMLLDTLFGYASQGIFITSLEPSCLCTIKDEWQSLHLDAAKLKIVSEMTRTIEEVLLQKVETLKPELSPIQGSIYIHTHCHEKADLPLRPSLQLLKALYGTKVQEIPSGCCGMAGSFGYEKEHYDVSMKIAHLVLGPALEKTLPQDIVVANGISCREQIHSLGKRRALHIVELLAL
jgi:Fe-S oxidoreductase